MAIHSPIHRLVLAPQPISNRDFQAEINDALKISHDFILHDTLLWYTMWATINGYAADRMVVTRTGVLLSALHALQQTRAEHDIHTTQHLVDEACASLNNLALTMSTPDSATAQAAAGLLLDCWYVDGQFQG